MWPHLIITFAFLPWITESLLILSLHFVAGLEAVSSPGPFEQLPSDLTTRQSPPSSRYFPPLLKSKPLLSHNTQHSTVPKIFQFSTRFVVWVERFRLRLKIRDCLRFWLLTGGQWPCGSLCLSQQWKKNATLTGSSINRNTKYEEKQDLENQSR